MISSRVQTNGAITTHEVYVNSLGSRECFWLVFFFKLRKWPPRDAMGIELNLITRQFQKYTSLWYKNPDKKKKKTDVGGR